MPEVIRELNAEELLDVLCEVPASDAYDDHFLVSPDDRVKLQIVLRDLWECRDTSAMDDSRWLPVPDFALMLRKYPVGWKLYAEDPSPEDE